ncbi:MAG: DEAD/DEAH box helicase family protein [Anaerolineaceae bacterium]|nr:DEAD/DEAH box helicase family protein [Anaerolineaceae bacterium]
MNEAETRAELIDPALAQSGWGVVEGSKILREYKLTAGRIQSGGGRAKPRIADYVLEYRGRKLAVIEAKSSDLAVAEGVAQAKEYAQKLQLQTAYACNGREIYAMHLQSGTEGWVSQFPSPQALWSLTFSEQDKWREAFEAVPFEDNGGSKEVRYYQEIAVNSTMAAIAEGKKRILLTLATGTGKTFIAFQIAWKLFQTRWNLGLDGKRRPRILFLADRNILADQAYNAFSAFPEDALVRIRPQQIRHDGRVPTNGSIFFTIFQTFMSGEDNTPNFGGYAPDFFDFIVIDECHRGGANDESTWRAILEYFNPAVQLGLTATPKRADNVDTYRYFGDPVYIYSLREGIEDGFLTPFKLKRIQTTLDEYMYTSDDRVVEGEIEEGRLYTEPDFQHIIEIKEREAKRVQIFMDLIDPNEKSIVFCATQDHAAAVRDLINQARKSSVPNYCVRVTANDGLLGEQYLREFQDNEKTIPTILTTSQKLSTGVDARNIRNIILMRPINSMIEFKQIIGRGTRLFEGKNYFTIYDFVNAYHLFADPEWDGEPIAPEAPGEPRKARETAPRSDEYEAEEDGTAAGPRKALVKLADGKEREIQFMVSTTFMGADGRPMTADEFLRALYGKLPDFFKNEEELRKLWSDPKTRKTLLDHLADAGYGRDELASLQKLINAEKSDIFDVVEYVAYAIKPITREARVAHAQSQIFDPLSAQQKEFLEFVLSKYIETGVEELDEAKLPALLTLKYQALPDALEILGNVEKVRSLFMGFQKHLYTGTAG